MFSLERKTNADTNVCMFSKQISIEIAHESHKAISVNSFSKREKKTIYTKRKRRKRIKRKVNAKTFHVFSSNDACQRQVNRRRIEKSLRHKFLLPTTRRKKGKEETRKWQMNNEWNGEKRFWLIGNNFKLFEYFSYILHCRFCLWFACACQFKSIASDWIKVVWKVFSYSFKFIIVKENLESFIAPAVFLFESFFFFFISSCCWTNSWFPVRSNPSSIVAKIQNGKYFRFSSLGPSFVLILIESMMSLNCNELKFCVLWQGQTQRRRRRQSKNSGERDKWIACLCELHWKQTTRKNQIEFVDSPNCPLKRLKAVSTQTKTQWHFHNDFDYVLGHSFCLPSLQFVCVCNFISWSMWVSVSDMKWAQNVNIKIYSFFFVVSFSHRFGCLFMSKVHMSFAVATETYMCCKLVIYLSQEINSRKWSTTTTSQSSQMSHIFWTFANFQL